MARRTTRGFLTAAARRRSAADRRFKTFCAS
jgi:hypothetical protein